MWVGLLIGALVLSIGVVYTVKCEYAFLPILVGYSIMLCGVAIFIIGSCYANDAPQNETKLYYISTINNSPRIYFSEYFHEGDNIVIPNHCYVEYSWINSWKYCNTPITVIVPKGVSVPIEGGVKRVYIVGGCQ